ncbi:hypothetical protein DFS34DRAFT_624794 [Phlyctochytrium arcticum]|nr:hypothetical protein DFS34DRAFT_624794 [Phlyctochytrium arcticum]
MTRLRKLEQLLDEDTTVHAILHTLFEEIFSDELTETIWANGESESSKHHRRHYLEKATGKKADCRVLSSHGEEIFVEAKSAKHADTSSEIVIDFYKLGLFLQGSVNMKVEKGFTPVCFGFHLLRETLDIFKMTLEHHGIYTMFHLCSCRVPTRLEDFHLLLHLMGALFHVKRTINSDLNPDSSDSDWELHLDSPFGSPGSPAATTEYVRAPLPTPVKKGKVFIKTSSKARTTTRKNS